MIKRGWIWVAVLAAAMLCLVGCGETGSEPLPSATERFFVNDFADVMTDADEQTVYEAGARMFEKTDAQVVLVTVDTLGGRDLESYALELARAWEIGDAEKDNGVLLLFTTDGPHSRLEIGYGLEGAINDSKAGRILDLYLVPSYDDADEWSAALTATYRGVLNEVYNEYGLTEEVSPMMPLVSGDEATGEDAIGLIVMVVILVIILSSIGRRGGGGFIPIFLGGFHHGGGFHHHGGGGFGGGGFGGGGFRGGGGGFGGGGASR